MMEVFSKNGYPMKTHLEYGVYQLEIPFTGEGKENVETRKWTTALPGV
jgi:hypothetical protein